MGPTGPPLDGDAGARGEGVDGRGGPATAALPRQLLNYKDAVVVALTIFPFCNTCARRMVWRDIMGADASAADPNIAADEHLLPYLCSSTFQTVSTWSMSLSAQTSCWWNPQSGYVFIENLSA